MSKLLMNFSRLYLLNFELAMLKKITMLLRILFLIQVYANDLTITIHNPANQTQQFVVYQNQSLNQAFDYKSQLSWSCAPINLQQFKSIQKADTSLKIQVSNSGDKNLAIQDVKVKCLDSQKINTFVEYDKLSVLRTNSSASITVGYQCTKETNRYNYWAIMEVTITFDVLKSISFYYQYICDHNYHPTRFDVSYLLLLIFMSIFVLLLSRFQKLRTLRIKLREKHDSSLQTIYFQGFYIGIKASTAYVILLTLTLFLSLRFQDQAEEIEIALSIFITILLSFIFLNEVQYKMKILRTVACWRIKIYQINSFLITGVIIYIYLRFNKPWPISNALTIFILGASIKLFKITSLKEALKFYTLCVIFDILLSTYAAINVRKEWDSLVLKYFNTPLTAQIPYFSPIYKKKCGWVSITAVLFPSFFLSYAHRFDRNSDSIIYRTTAFLGLLIGLVVWFILSSLYSIPLPVSIFTLVPMVGISALIAYQRNEFNPYWSGHFYDQVLLNPFRHSLRSHRSEEQQPEPAAAKLSEIELPILKAQQEQEGLIKQTKSGKFIIKDDLFQNLI